MEKIPLSLKSKPKTYSINLVRKLMKAIKQNCYRCMGIPPTSKREDCELDWCPLYPYRPWAQRSAIPPGIKPASAHQAPPSAELGANQE